jgi:hypothetical protein
VEHGIDVPGRAIGEPVLFEVSLEKFDFLVYRNEVLLCAAGKVVGDANVGALRDEVLDEVAADERGSTCDEDTLSRPICHSSAPPSATVA